MIRSLESAVELAGGPVSWGVDFAEDPANPAPDEVVAGIAAAELRWMELGPAGYGGPRCPSGELLRGGAEQRGPCPSPAAGANDDEPRATRIGQS